MKYYKVVDRIDTEVIIDTNITNYGKTLTKWDFYYPLVSFILKDSRINNLPLDFYFTINEGIAAWGQQYLETLPISGSIP